MQVDPMALRPFALNVSSKHLHLCADNCGDYYVCSQHDGCPNTWTCPHCEQVRLDHHMTTLETIQTQEASNGIAR